MPIFAHVPLLQRLTGLIYFPINHAFPHFGLLAGGMYLPAKFRIRFLEPVRFERYGPDAADDVAFVQQVADDIRAAHPGRAQRDAAGAPVRLVRLAVPRPSDAGGSDRVRARGGRASRRSAAAVDACAALRALRAGWPLVRRLRSAAGLRRRRRAHAARSARRCRSTSPCQIGDDKVTASPAKFGAGPITLLVANQSGASQTLTIDGPRLRRSVGPDPARGHRHAEGDRAARASTRSRPPRTSAGPARRGSGRARSARAPRTSCCCPSSAAAQAAGGGRRLRVIRFHIEQLMHASLQ